MVQKLRWFKSEKNWLLLCSGIAIISTFLLGFQPDPYLIHVQGIKPPHPYPTQPVLWIVGFVILHTILLYPILEQKSLMGLGVIAILNMVFLIVAMSTSIYSPLVWGYSIWALLVSLWISLSFLVMLYRRFRSLVLKYKR